MTPLRPEISREKITVIHIKKKKLNQIDKYKEIVMAIYTKNTIQLLHYNLICNKTQTQTQSLLHM